MPDSTITTLSYLAGVLAVLYVGLMITTVVEATLQTSLRASVHETEGTIATLETTYYSSVAKLNAMDPHATGLVYPTAVTYTEARPSIGLSLAN